MQSLDPLTEQQRLIGMMERQQLDPMQKQLFVQNGMKLENDMNFNTFIASHSELMQGMSKEAFEEMILKKAQNH